MEIAGILLKIIIVAEICIISYNFICYRFEFIVKIHHMLGLYAGEIIGTIAVLI